MLTTPYLLSSGEVYRYILVVYQSSKLARFQQFVAPRKQKCQGDYVVVVAVFHAVFIPAQGTRGGIFNGVARHHVGSVHHVGNRHHVGSRHHDGSRHHVESMRLQRRNFWIIKHGKVGCQVLVISFEDWGKQAKLGVINNLKIQLKLHIENK
jgi:hypothetical protein